MAEIVKALSLTRPWDELILLGLKPIENRTWGTKYRGRLVIHAARSWDPNALHLARDLGVPEDVLISLGERRTVRSGYRGTVTLTDICTAALYGHRCTCGPWAFTGQRHWHVSNPIRIPGDPIPGKGQLGLWIPPATVLDHIGAPA